MTAQQAVLFGPAPEPKVKKPWRPTKDQRRIVQVMTEYGKPVTDDLLYHLLEGDLRPGMIAKHIDTLVKKGVVRDTGCRGQWTTQGRCIIWALV